MKLVQESYIVIDEVDIAISSGGIYPTRIFESDLLKEIVKGRSLINKHTHGSNCISIEVRGRWGSEFIKSLEDTGQKTMISNIPTIIVRNSMENSIRILTKETIFVSKLKDFYFNLFKEVNKNKLLIEKKSNIKTTNDKKFPFNRVSRTEMAIHEEPIPGCMYIINITKE